MGEKGSWRLRVDYSAIQSIGNRVRGDKRRNTEAPRVCLVHSQWP